MPRISVLLLTLVVLHSVALASAGAAQAAGGLQTWCHHTEPGYIPQTLTRLNYGPRGAYACQGHLFHSATDPDYTGCPVRMTAHMGVRA